MKITKTAVAGAELPTGKTEWKFWDDDIPGFGLRIRKGGSRTLIFQYRQGAKQRKLTLGSATALGIEAARSEARRLHAQVRLGHDPFGDRVEARARAVETFGALLKPYLDHKRKELRPRSFIEIERHLTKHAKPLQGRQLAKIDQRSIAALLTPLTADSGPTEANHVRASLSAFFGWAQREGLADANPVMNTNKAAENSGRERVLNADEMHSIWNTVGDDDYGIILKLLLLTGQRREEIGGLRRQEIDLDKAVISLGSERTKNKRMHDIPLSGPAIVLLKSHLAKLDPDREYIFGSGKRRGYSAWTYQKKALDQRLAEAGTPISDWTPHDLRRTLSTVAHEELGIAPHIVEAVLNHVSGHRAGVAGRYNKALYSREKSRALAQWGAFVMATVEGRKAKAKVVPFKSA
jgi:integrase